jgi:hypothetical protein
MPHAAYRKEAGQYAMYLDEHRIFTTPEVALLVNKSGYVLVNHGPVEEVNKRHLQLLRAAAKRSELGDVADLLVVVTGQFDVDELNRIIDRKQTVRALYNRLELEAARAAGDVLSQFALQQAQ